MSKWLKLVTVWLLTLAMPAQGFAAAAMVHCGPSHERMHGAAAPAHGHTADHQDEGSIPTDHAHGGMTADGAAGHPHAGVGASSTPDKLTDLGQYKCGACGSCCSAAAMPGFLLRVPATAPIAQWDAMPSQGRVGFLTDGPERPPRLVLA